MQNLNEVFHNECVQACEEGDAQRMLNLINRRLDVVYVTSEEQEPPFLVWFLNDCNEYFDPAETHAIICALIDAYPVVALHPNVLSRLMNDLLTENETFGFILQHIPKEQFHNKHWPLVHRLVDFFDCDYIPFEYFRYRLDALIKYGADVNAPLVSARSLQFPIQRAFNCEKHSERVADLLLKHGAHDQGILHPFFDKRNRCTGARIALGVCLLLKHRTWLQKDVIRSIILPMVWDTRFDDAWYTMPVKRVRK